MEILSYFNLSVSIDASDFLFNYFSTAESIISLRFFKTNILSVFNSMKVLANHLVNMKNIQELVFDQSYLGQDLCKILADSLMRMKNLKIFVIRESNPVGLGLSSIIYNLAFSPNLLKLDISRCLILNTNEVA